MSTYDGNNFYYSGQGVVLIGKRDALGKPAGLIPVGNVSDLKISISTSALEHKESQTGQRGIDLRLITETKASLSVTIENFIAANLADALKGSNTHIGGSSVLGEAAKLYWGKVTPLSFIDVSSVVVNRGATILTAYVNETTPYDYKVNNSAGSILLNDGASVAIAATGTALGATPTAITVGATTVIAVANTSVVGDYVALSGFAGADAALVNNKAFRIVTATPTGITIALNTVGKVITIGTPKAVFDGTALTIDYNYNAQNLVDALTVGSLDRYLRFEGLNTADGDKPVVVEVFKFQVDPAKEIALIGEGIGQFVLEGNVLADPLQLTGSKYFKQTLLR